MQALQTEGVTAGYGKIPIINDISVSAETGLITTIIGPNGAGKSTFAKTLVGILKPMSGRIAVNGVPQWDGAVPEPEFLRRILSASSTG